MRASGGYYPLYPPLNTPLPIFTHSKHYFPTPLKLAFFRSCSISISICEFFPQILQTRSRHMTIAPAKWLRSFMISELLYLIITFILKKNQSKPVPYGQHLVSRREHVKNKIQLLLCFSKSFFQFFRSITSDSALFDQMKASDEMLLSRKKGKKNERRHILNKCFNLIRHVTE